MNESQIENFPHLFQFIEKHMGENTGVISQEVADELKTLIESYEGYTAANDSDYKFLLEKLSALEEENSVLKKQNSEFERHLEEQISENSQIRKTVIENKSIQKELINVNDDKMMELTDELQRTRLEAENLRRDFAKLKEMHSAKEQKFDELEAQHQNLLLKFDKEFSMKNNINSQNIQDLELLKTALDSKKEECVMLHKSLNKLKSQNKKLTQNNEILKQSYKANENILKNLEKKIKEVEESRQIFITETEQKIHSYLNTIDNLKRELRKFENGQNFEMKMQEIHPGAIKQENEIKIETTDTQNKLALGNLQDYEEFFSSSRNINFLKDEIMLNQNSFYNGIVENSFTRQPPNLCSDFEQVNAPNDFQADIQRQSQELEEILRQNAEGHLSNDDDDDPTIVFPKTIKHRDSKEIVRSKLEVKIKQDMPQPENEDKIDPIVLQSNLQTNKIDIKDELDKMITKRLTLSKQRRPDIFEEPKLDLQENLNPGQIQNKNVEISKIREVEKFSEFKFSQIKETTAIEMNSFVAFIEFMENYLTGQKNPTTLTLTEFEKNRLIQKFSNSQTQNFRKFFVLIMKYFLEYVNFIEGQISNLIYAKSYLEIKVENMKSEFNFLLKNFIDKNQQSQNFLNEVNRNFNKLKEANRNKLNNYIDTLSRRNSNPKDEKAQTSKAHQLKSEKRASRKNPRQQISEENPTSENNKRKEKSKKNVKNKKSEKNVPKILEEKERLKDAASLDLISQSDLVAKKKVEPKAKSRVDDKKEENEKGEENLWSKFVSVISFKQLGE